MVGNEKKINESFLHYFIYRDIYLVKLENCNMNINKLKKERINYTKTKHLNKEVKATNISTKTIKKISLMEFLILFFILLLNCNQVFATNLTSEIEKDSTQFKKTKHYFHVYIIKNGDIILDDGTQIIEVVDEKNSHSRLDSLRKAIAKEIVSSSIHFVPFIPAADKMHDSYTITLFIESSTRVISYLKKFERVLEQKLKNFAIPKNIDIQNSFKKSTKLRFETITKVNNLYEKQNNYLEKIFKKSKDYSNTYLVKTRSINKELCIINNFKGKDFNTKSSENIYNLIDRYTDESENFLDIAEYIKDFKKYWPFHCKIEIKYFNKYIDESKHTIENINKPIDLTKKKWLKNITTVRFVNKHSLDKIIYYLNNNKIKDIYLNENIKFPINKKLEKFINNVNPELKFFKRYKNEIIVTIKENNIKIIEKDINHQANKLQHKHKKDKLIIENNQFIDNVFSITHDDLNSSYNGNSFLELEEFTNTINKNLFEEKGEILYEEHNEITNDCESNKSDSAKISDEIYKKKDIYTYNTNVAKTYTDFPNNSFNQAPGLPPSELGCNNNPKIYTYFPTENETLTILLEELFESLKEFIKKRFNLNQLNNQPTMEKHFKYILEKNEVLRNKDNLTKVFYIVSVLIDKTRIIILEIGDFISIFEYVFLYIQENLKHNRNMTFEDILSHYGIELYDLSNNVERSYRLRFTFINLKKTYQNLVHEYISFSVINIILFSNIHSGIFHYYKHRKIGGRILTFFEYLILANYYINITLRDYVRNVRDSDVNYGEYRIKYTVKWSAFYKNERFEMIIRLFNENIKLRLVFDRYYDGRIFIITFYEVDWSV